MASWEAAHLGQGGRVSGRDLRVLTPCAEGADQNARDHDQRRLPALRRVHAALRTLRSLLASRKAHRIAMVNRLHPELRLGASSKYGGCLR